MLCSHACVNSVMHYLHTCVYACTEITEHLDNLNGLTDTLSMKVFIVIIMIMSIHHYQVDGDYEDWVEALRLLDYQTGESNNSGEKVKFTQ